MNVRRQTIDIEEWIETDADFQCAKCGNQEVRIEGQNRGLMAFKCEDESCDYHDPGHVLEPLEEEGESFFPPIRWCVGEPAELRYRCPSCCSVDIERSFHKGPKENIHVLVSCKDCNEYTTE